MFISRIVPVTEEFAKNNINSVIALYVTEENGAINFGVPSLGAYKPASANMFGFKNSINKGFYRVLRKDENIENEPVYFIEVSDDHIVSNFELLTDVESDDLLNVFKNDNNDVLTLTK